jgi:hypothetical protein
LLPQNAANGVLQVQDGALGLSGTTICTTNLLGKIANASMRNSTMDFPIKGKSAARAM